MGPRRRRWRRTAAKAALVALGLTVLGLLGSGEGEELLAAVLAAWGEGRGAWGEGRDGGDWGVGVGGAGEAWGGSWGGAFMNGERGNRAGLVNGERGKGAGLAGGGAGFMNGGAGFMNGEGGEWGEAMPNGRVGGEKSGAGVPNGSRGVTNGGSRVPPGCVGLLSGGSGDLAEGPWWLPRDPRTPRVLLAPPPCAPPAPPFLLLLVPSAPAHLERRLAVRDTWGGSWAEPGTPPSRTVFVLGVPPGPDGQRELLSESRQHGDILQGDFGDSYANLTRKTLLLLRWARACCGGAPFLLKADDDVFVNVPAVATYLATWPAPPRLYLGRVHWGVAPNRDPRSRHHVPPGIYGAARYPPYCSGTAYVLSRQAATGVLGGALAVPLAVPEDVWVGLGARRAGLAPRHSARFGGSLRVPPERCCLGRALLSAHRLRPPEIRRVWEGLRELREEPRGCPRILHGALGRLRCRVMAWGERVWGGGGDVME